MAPTRQEVIDHLRALSLEELWALLREVVEPQGFEVSRFVARPPARGSDGRLLYDYDVRLLDAGPKRVWVLKALREQRELPLTEARALLDQLPATVATFGDREDAQRFVDALAELGAAAEIERLPARVSRV